jgi:hypothetical protein
MPHQPTPWRPAPLPAHATLWPALPALHSAHSRRLPCLAPTLRGLLVLRWLALVQLAAALRLQVRLPAGERGHRLIGGLQNWNCFSRLHPCCMVHNPNCTPGWQPPPPPPPPPPTRLWVQLAGAPISRAGCASNSSALAMAPSSSAANSPAGQHTVVQAMRAICTSEQAAAGGGR